MNMVLYKAREWEICYLLLGFANVEKDTFFKQRKLFGKMKFVPLRQKYCECLLAKLFYSIPPHPPPRSFSKITFLDFCIVDSLVLLKGSCCDAIKINFVFRDILSTWSSTGNALTFQNRAFYCAKFRRKLTIMLSAPVSRWHNKVLGSSRFTVKGYLFITFHLFLFSYQYI